MRTWFATAAAAASIALGLSLAACGSSAHQAASSTGSTQDASGRSQLEAMVHCLRAHGVPDFPDPVYDPSDGRWHYADFRPAIPDSTQQACQHLYPSAVGASPPVPQAQFQRSSGWPNACGTRRAHLARSRPRRARSGCRRRSERRHPPNENAVNACQRYMPSGGLNVHAAS